MIATADAQQVTAAAGGSDHTVFLKADGTLWAVGSNGNGQLGDGTQIDRPFPVQIASGVASISAANNFTTFIKTDGTLWGAGYNILGELGDGNTANYVTTPELITSNVASVAVGETHTMFIKTDGTLWAMGDNSRGQLGTGNLDPQLTPVQVATGVAQVAVGRKFSLFVKTDGKLYAVGANGTGQLGLGTVDDGQGGQITVDQSTPQLVATGVAKVSAGTVHAMFIKNDGTLWGMGANADGEIDTTLGEHDTPVAVSGATGVIAVATGAAHTVFLKSDGSLWAMGSNDEGQLGSAGATAGQAPVQVATAVSAVATGSYHTLFVGRNGVLWGFGFNSAAELATGDVNNRFAPVPIPAVRVAAGDLHSAIVRADGTLWTTGGDLFGELGNGTSTANEQTTFAQATTGVASVVAGHNRTMFIKTDGTLWGLGRNSHAELGDATLSSHSTPVQMPGGSQVVSVGLGHFHTAFVKSDGTLWTIGLNVQGQLGDNTNTDRTSPVQVKIAGTAVTDAVRVSVGFAFTAFLRADGSLWAVGDDTHGQLGDGPAHGTDVNDPVQVDSDVVAFAAGQSFLVYVKSDGTLWSVGQNNAGQLGTGAFDGSDVTTPVQVTFGSSLPVVTLAAGAESTLFVTADGSLWAMGDNEAGQIGDGGNSFEYSPVQVTKNSVPIGNVVSVATSEVTGQEHSLFVKTDGSVWAMGDDESGELGDTNPNLQLQVFAEQITPGISAPPVDQSVTATGSTSFSTTATGPGTLSYQWYHNGVAIGGATTSSVAVNTAMAADAGYYYVKVANEAGPIVSDAATLTVNKASQSAPTINSANSFVLGNAYNATVGASGHGAVIWTLNGGSTAGGAAIDSSTGAVTATTVGTVVINATYAGDANYNASAASADFSILVNPVPTTFALDATSFTYTGSARAPNVVATPSNATFGEGGTISATNVGNYTATATATGNYSGSNNSLAWSITPANQSAPVISSANSLVFGSAYTATANSGFGAVSWSLGTGSTATGAAIDPASGAVTASSIGTVVIKAAFAGDGNHNASAASADFTITIGKAPATFALNVSTFGYDGSPHGPTVIPTPSNATFSSGGQLSATNIGNYTATATATGNYSGSNNALGWSIVKGAQTISFAGPGDQAYTTAPITLSATSTSGLPVAFSVVSGAATINGSALTLSGGGTVTVRAAQAGNGNYNAAPDVDRTFTVSVPYTFTTLAGAPSDGTTDATGTAARFHYPQGLATDASGNLYVSDTENHTIRKITPAGVVTTFAGSPGNPGFANGTGAAARFAHPRGLAFANGILYVADRDNHAIRKIASDATVTTLVQNSPTYVDPIAVAVDHAGNVFLADYAQNTICKVTPDGSSVTVFAGTAGQSGSTDATGTAASFNFPYALAIDGSDNLFVADLSNNAIRKITPARVVTTFAGLPGAPVDQAVDGNGSTARFFDPQGLTADANGNIYVADTEFHLIRKITPNGDVTTVAGTSGVFGVVDGTGAAARFNEPQTIAVDGNGTLYVASLNDNAIRKVTAAGVVTTFAGKSPFGLTDGTGAAASFFNPIGVETDSAGNTYVADTMNHTIRKITPGGVVTTFAGSAGQSGFVNATGGAARFYYPYGLTVDSADNVYVMDSGNSALRKITPAGVVSTVATGLGNVYGISQDAAGNFYGGGNQQVFKVSPAGVVTAFAGTASVYGWADGNGAAAQFKTAFDTAVDGFGNVFVTDAFNESVRKITPARDVTTFAGSPVFTGGDDGAGGAARFDQPWGIAVDGAGNVYVADEFNHTIRKITPAGVVSTIGGLAQAPGSVDGTGSAARFNRPQGIAVDGSGNIRVSDTGNGLIRVGTRPTLITISTQPVSQIASAGATVNLTVAASGPPGLIYQWRRNGANIPGANSSSYSIGSLAPANAGDYSVVVSTDDALATSHVAAIRVSAPVVLGSLNATYDGAAKAATATTTPPGLTVRFTYDGSATLPTSAGSYAVAAVMDDPTYAGSANGTLVIAKATPNVDWNSLAPITYGTALSATQLNATANVPGAFVYNPAAGAVLNAGSQSLGVTFTPTDTTDFVGANATNSVTVQKANQSAPAISSASSFKLGTPYTATASTGIGAVAWSLGTGSTAAGAAINSTSGVVTATGAGTVVIKASFAGDANHNASAASADFTITVTPASGLLSASDFNGDGKSDLLWQNTLTGQRSLWLMNGANFIQGVDLGAIPTNWVITATGDFNGDGKPDLVWSNNTTGERSIWLMNGGTFLAGVSLGTVPTEWVIAATGDFNGDGQTDLVWQNMTTGERSIWLMNGTSFASGLSLGVIPTEWVIAATGDFNGDGRSDLVWENTLTGQHSIWLMSGAAFLSGVDLGTVPNTMQLTWVGDFNGDGQPDLVWSDFTTGAHTLWLMNGTVHTGTIALPSAPEEWVVGIVRPHASQAVNLDFNNDRQSDLLWRNTTTGQLSIWLMNGTTFASGVNLGTVPTNWVITAAGALDGPGNTDLVWENTTTGQRSIWLMQGTTNVGGWDLGVVSTDWVITAVADFNGDSQADLLWTNTVTGQRKISMMSGAHIQSEVNLGVIPVEWVVQVTGDFNGDGKPDLVWQNTITGQRAIWLMNGTTFISGVDLGIIPTEWRIVAVGDYNGDGKPDFVWENQITGQRSIWLMNGTTFIGGVDLGTIDLQWRLMD